MIVKKKNNEEEENNINNDINKKEIDFNKLRPLIGANGLPVRDSENNFVFLDENNKPVKNTGFYLLLDQNGKPVPNSKGQPILINSEGKPINLVDNDKNVIDNQLLNKMMNPNQKGNNINIINPQNKNENNNIEGFIKLPKTKPKKTDRKNQEINERIS